MLDQILREYTHAKRLNLTCDNVAERSGRNVAKYGLKVENEPKIQTSDPQNPLAAKSLSHIQMQN